MTSQEQEKQIEQLSLIEQNVNSLVTQRQNFSSQLAEADSALNQVKGQKSAFKIIGNIMVEMPAPDLQKEIQRKKELLEVRIKALMKQEEQLKSKAKQIQEQVMSSMKAKSG